MSMLEQPTDNNTEIYEQQYAEQSTTYLTLDAGQDAGQKTGQDAGQRTSEGAGQGTGQDAYPYPYPYQGQGAYPYQEPEKQGREQGRHRIGIIGLGLIGGSIALKLSEKMAVAGYDIDPSTINIANSMGIAMLPSIDDVMAYADVILICTPIGSFPEIVQLLVSAWQRRSAQFPSTPPIVADTCSVKRYIHEWAGQLRNVGIPFIGTHPMAGKHTNGIVNAQADIFEGHTWAVSITDSINLTALLTISEIILSTGSTLVPVDPITHDKSVALVSHLPHVIAAIMSLLLQSDELSTLDRSLVAGSFDDVTRVAGSPPELTSQMCAANIDMLTKSLQRFSTEIERVGHGLADLEYAPGHLNDLFTEAHRSYSQLHAGISGKYSNEHHGYGTYSNGNPDTVSSHSAIFTLDDPQTLTNWMLGLGRDGGRIVDISYLDATENLIKGATIKGATENPTEVSISFAVPPTG